MKMKDLEKLFEKQPYRVIDVKGKKVKTGKVWFGIRYGEGDNKPYKYLVSHCDRSDIKKLKDYAFEKFTGAGYPIFQTMAFISENPIEMV